MDKLKSLSARKAPQAAPAANSDALPSSPVDPPPGQTLLPLDPLTDAIERRGGMSGLDATIPDAQCYYRARQRGGITSAEADRLAIGLLGEHPSAVWGWDAWTASCDNDDEDDA